jgi:hypothetical protein
VERQPTHVAPPSLARLRRNPIALLGAACALVAILGAVDVIVRDFGAPQSCPSDVHRPYFPAYPAIALGFLAIVLRALGAILVRRGVIARYELGTVGAVLGAVAMILAFGGLVFYGPVC